MSKYFHPNLFLRTISIWRNLPPFLAYANYAYCVPPNLHYEYYLVDIGCVYDNSKYIYIASQPIYIWFYSELDL